MAAIDLTAGLDISDAAKKLKELRDAAKMAVSGVAGDINATEALFNGLAARIDKAKADIKKAQSEVSTNKEWIQKLRTQAAEAQEALSVAPANAVRKVVQRELDAIHVALNEEKGLLGQNQQKLTEYREALVQSQQALRMARTEWQAQKQALAGAAGSYGSVSTRLAGVRNEMAALELSGRTNSARYRELQGELESLGTAYRKVQFEQKALSTGATQWAGIQSALQGIMGGFAAYQGVLGLVADSSEELVKIQTRLQSALSIIMGLTQVSNTLHATSATRMTTLTKVTELWDRANRVVASGLIRLGLAADTARIAAASMNAVLTMGISVAIGMAVDWISKLIDKHKAAKKAAEESARKQREAFEDYASSVGQSAGGAIAKFQVLRQQYKELGNDLAARKKFIKENAEAFKELGIKVGDVNEAENTFVNNSEAFIASLQLRAQAAAAMEMAGERYKQGIEKKMEAANVKVRASRGGYSASGLTEEQQAELSDVITKATGKKRVALGAQRAARYHSSEEIEKMVRKAGLEAGIAYINSVRQNLNNEANKLIAEGDDLIKFSIGENNKAAQTLRASGIITTKGDEEKARKATESRINAESDAQKKLSEIIQSSQWSLLQSRIDVMTEGKEKELAQLKKNTDEKVAAIREERQKELDAYNAVRAASGQTPVDGLSADRENVYTEQIENISAQSAARRLAIEQKYADQVKNIYASVAKHQLSEEERRIAGIGKRYDELRAAVDKKMRNGTISASDGKNLIGMLDASEQQEKLQVMLDNIRSYHQQRQDIINKYVQREAILRGKDGSLKEGVTQENIDELNREKEKALSVVDEAFAQRESSYRAWLATVVDMSLEQLELAIIRAKEELEELERSGSGDTQQHAVARSRLNVLQQRYTEATATIQGGDSGPGDESIRKWQKLRKTLSDIDKEFQQIGETIGGTAGQAISLAGTLASSTISIIDGIETLVQGTSEGVEKTTQAASSAIQSLETASVILAIISAAMKIAMALYKVFSGPSAGTRRYEELKEQYESLIDVWDDLIARKKEYIEMSWGEELKEVGDQTLELIRKKQDSQRELFRASTSAKDKRHTKGENMWGGWNGVVGDINAALGTNITGMDDFASLTAKDLQWIKENYAVLWASMYDDSRTYLENIIACDEELKETTTSINEQWTQLSFDDIYNSFVDMLLDMDSSAADFAVDFEQYMQRAIISMFAGQELQPRLAAWYAKFAEYAKSGNELTEEEVEALREDLGRITQEGLKAREQLMESFDWSNTLAAQEASERGFQAMSEDTGSELNGRFTAIQGDVHDIRNLLYAYFEGEETSPSGDMAQGSEHGYGLVFASDLNDRIIAAARSDDHIFALMTAFGDIRRMSENQLGQSINIRDIMIQLNGNVADIRTYTRVLPEMSDTLKSMNRKLNDL